MTIKAVKTAVNRRISEHGGTVYSSETDEGFKKPCFFVDVFPVQTERISAAYEELTVRVEIRYESAEETQSACIAMADKLTAWFSEPLEVGGRALSTDEITCETEDDTVLYVSFAYSVTRKVHGIQSEEETAPVMEDMDESLSFEMV